ncbi:MAG: ribose transport system permease protein [Thermoleophilales bacterium]|nr:ribose transport system permease protein [Thermoleophilales bacterium]
MSAVANQVGALRRKAGVQGVPPIVPAIVVLTVLLFVYGSVRQNAFTDFSMQELSNVTATLAILADGQTLVVISGGFDFSAVAVLAFLNAFFVTQIDNLSGSYVLVSIVVLAVAVGIGTINGLLVGYLRVQSIIATIAMFFVLSGGALALLNRPGGSVSSAFSLALSEAWGPIPASAGVMAIVALIWLALKRLRYGNHLYAVGSNAQAAYARGVPVKRTLVATYALAGLFYGIAALNYTAATASGDPRISFVLLGQMFAAVVIGGTAFGGGRGGAVGSILGALSLALLEAILFSLGFESFYSGIVFGLVLMLVVLPTSIGGQAIGWFKSRRAPAAQPALATPGTEE